MQTKKIGRFAGVVAVISVVAVSDKGMPIVILGWHAEGDVGTYVIYLFRVVWWWSRL